MISNSNSQLGLRRIGALINVCFNILNARSPSLLMKKSFVSFRDFDVCNICFCMVI